MKYEKPNLFGLNRAEWAAGVCNVGSGDTADCTAGNAALASCATGIDYVDVSGHCREGNTPPKSCQSGSADV